MAAEAPASRRSGGASPSSAHKLRRLRPRYSLGVCITRWCSSHFLMAVTMLVFLLLLPLQQQGVTAIVCEVDARDGLEAATASVATAAADRQQLVHMLPLCRVPYLVNSQLPPKDVPHVGMERGGECCCCCWFMLLRLLVPLLHLLLSLVFRAFRLAFYANERSMKDWFFASQEL